MQAGKRYISFSYLNELTVLFSIYIYSLSAQIYLLMVAVPESLTLSLVFFFLGWSCKGNDGPVTSLEGINVNPERKVREKRSQSGDRQENDKSWQKQKGLDELGCCDLQYNEEDNTAINGSSENNIFNLVAVRSIKKNTNINNQRTQLSSTHL